ncbi:MAG: TVP38/TMEM64 family membrane protein [Sporanaerobacter sp.]|jgi:uncharacterized membrane protein YdjX (TVP38/TMEM64 family)|uniref:TVP38/TMEM64 family protein n=1 Tax=Sporanaerobacter sp. TaxID=2010183 RepID=UPI003A102DDE
MEKSKKDIFKYIAVLCIVVGLAIVINKHNILKKYGPNEIKDYIQSFGVWAPLIYIGILSILPLLLFPDSVLVIAGGMIFGLFKGIILTSIGSLIGATIAFYLARALGQQAIKKIIKKDLVIFKDNSKMNGFFLILMLRLIPLFPFKVVSYSAGLSDVKYKDFCMATIIGSLPGILVYTNLGDKTTVFGSKDFYMAIGLLVVLFVISFILKKILKSKKENYDE